MTSTVDPIRFDDLKARYGSSFRWLVVGTATFGSFSSVIASTTVNVAIPDIMGAFGLGHDKAQWISTGFLAATTVTMLVTPWLVESFGARATFIGALILFELGAAIGSAAPNEDIVTIARVLQGAGAGCIQPINMMILFRVFPAHERGRAMGFFALGGILGPAAGPVIAGMLIDSLGWRYVFTMGTPFNFIGILLAFLFMPGWSQTARRGFDWLGFLFLTAALTLVLIALSNGQQDGWLSDTILIEFAAAGAATIAFVARERLTRHPLLDLAVFQNPAFLSATLISFVFGVGMFGQMYLLPLFVQTIQGYSATLSGLLLLPAAIFMGIAFPLAGVASDHLPLRVPILCGLAIFALSTLLMGSVDFDTPLLTLVIYTLIGRLGLSLIIPALNAGGLSALTPAQLNQGSGLMNFTRQLGGAFGVNILATMIDRRTSFYGQNFATDQVDGNGAMRDFMHSVEGLLAQGGATPDLAHNGALQMLGTMIFSQSSMMGFRDGYLIVTGVFLLALVPALSLRGGPRRRWGHTPVAPTGTSGQAAPAE
ncbi:MAG: DHA2 family efflux MFS transporter permease subunit [Alphaproteobacteria bacterium]|nr:DHA2 family efflux MFS transporter permease subunit [Alphaproteobacteria bacterium]